MRALCWILLLTLSLAVPHAPCEAKPSANKRGIEALAKRWLAARPWSRFDAWKPETRRALLAEASKIELAPGSFDAVLAILWKRFHRAAPKWKQEIETPYGKATWIQKGKGGPKSGLLIGLHGGGEGAGSAGEAAGNWTLSKHLCIYPQGVRLVSDTWNTVHGERFILTLIAWAKARYDIDPDQVRVVGFSMGGTGSFHMAGRHPDQLAAAAPGHGVVMAENVQGVKPEDVGALQFGLVPNVRNVGMYFFTGSDDGNCEPGTFHRAWQMIEALKATDAGGYKNVVFTKYEGLAHAFGPGEPGKALKFVAARTREPFPDTLVWEQAVEPYPLPDTKDKTTRLPKRRFYWLRCNDPVDQALVRATKKRVEDRLEIQLEVTGGDPESYSILINPTMMAGATKIRVTYEGQVLDVARKPSFATLLETLDEESDRVMVFDQEVRLGDR